MIFFWDRNIPKSIPEAFRTLTPPFESEVHGERFPQFDRIPERGDDNWISILGDYDWFLLTKDYQLHRKSNEAAALRRHNIGCFYIWGLSAKPWDIARCFMMAAPSIIEVAESTARPFIYRVDHLGKLSPVPLAP